MNFSALELKYLRSAYEGQKRSAKQRGVRWRFVFQDWLELWAKSGHLNERGARKGQYCMARKGDKGPYSRTNVDIVPVEQNHADRRGRPIKPRTKEHCEAISEGRKGITPWMKGKTFTEEQLMKLRAPKSPEHKKRISEAMKGRPLSLEHRASLSLVRRGKPKSEETKLRMSEAQKKRWSEKEMHA